jgi:hypothetical protein
MFTVVLINDPVSGDCFVLDSQQKIAHVLSHPTDGGAIYPPVALGMPPARLVVPGFDIAEGAPFALAATYASPVQGTQVSLGKKAIDGISAVGTRLKHQVRASEFGNELPIFVTVEQWFSPDLGVALRDTRRTTIGGEIEYRLEQIARSEPDAALFKVPSDYIRKPETVNFRTEVIAPTPGPPRPPQPPAPHFRFAPAPCPSPVSGAESNPQPSHAGKHDTPPPVVNCFRMITP